MSSMIFASSPLSVQSLVKLRTNSNYTYSTCYVPSPSRPKNSYVHLSYNNISRIESSKSSFTKGDGNFSFSLPKFQRVTSTLSPSLNVIKACTGKENIYHFKAIDKRKPEDKNIQLSDRYMGKLLLIVNIPQESEYATSEIELLNDLHRHNKDKEFEVLGFLHDKKDLKEEKDHKGLSSLWHPHNKDPKEEKDLMKEEEILEKAEFTIFEKVEVNNDHKWELHKTRNQNEDLWYFLRTTPMGNNLETVGIIKEEFEKFLVDGTGKPIIHWPRIPTKTMPDKIDGGNPGDISSNYRVIKNLSSRDIIQESIDEYFSKL